jgi:hypothetical protein
VADEPRVVGKPREPARVRARHHRGFGVDHNAIPDTLCLADWYTANCFHLDLTLARLLAARGDDWRASALLERWRWSDGSTPSFVLATLELGRIAERLGDRRKAAECYGFVMAAWRRPDRELLPYVAEAREGLARLHVE